MSLRSKFGSDGCKRFGDDKESVAAMNKNAPSGGSSGKSDMIYDDKIVKVMREEIDTLNALVRNLRQQVANQAIEIAELKREKSFEKNVSGVTPNSSAKRGRKPTLTPEAKQKKSAARVKAWREAKRDPKP